MQQIYCPRCKTLKDVYIKPLDEVLVCGDGTCIPLEHFGCYCNGCDCHLETFPIDKIVI